MYRKFFFIAAIFICFFTTKDSVSKNPYAGKLNKQSVSKPANMPIKLNLEYPGLKLQELPKTKPIKKIDYVRWISIMKFNVNLLLTLWDFLNEEDWYEEDFNPTKNHFSVFGKLKLRLDELNEHLKFRFCLGCKWHLKNKTLLKRIPLEYPNLPFEIPRYKLEESYPFSNWKEFLYQRRNFVNRKTKIKR